MASSFDYTAPSEQLLAYQDFIPEILGDKNYETLEKVVEKANRWLESHPEHSVRLCETLNMKFHSKNVDPQRTSYVRKGDDDDDSFITERNKYLRCLRLWLVPDNSDSRPVQIGVKTYVPKPIPDAYKEFETLDATVKAINDSFVMNPVEGRIISVETKAVKYSSPNRFDPSKSNWSEPADDRKYFVFVIRIFYEYGKPVVETVELRDFCPNIPTTKTGELYYEYLKDAEEFHHVFDRVRQWCQSAEGIRVPNIQTIDIKMKITNFNENRQLMAFTEHNEEATIYWRSLRVVCLTQAQAKPPQMLSYKTFSPVPLTDKGKFEGMKETFDRVQAWLKIVKRDNDVGIFSFETMAIRYDTGGEKHHGNEAAWTVYKGGRNERWTYIVRLYLNGSFTEPPPNMLPFVPPILHKAKCDLQ